MIGLRQKLMIGFGVLFIILSIIGVQSISYLTHLGQSIDVILRENYRSVIACQRMKEGLERIDSGLLFTLLGDVEEGEALIRRNQTEFEDALRIELDTITLPGEHERAVLLQELFKNYQTSLISIKDTARAFTLRRADYFNILLPMFERIKAAAEDILQMNQKSMNDANDRARALAAQARRQMVLYLILGAIIAAACVIFSGQWILRPIRQLIVSTDEIRQGNLDLVVAEGPRDEIGRLAESFNAMTASLRELRRTDQAKLLRIQKATQQAFDRLPDAIAVLDLTGKVEVSTESAKNLFGLRPGTEIALLEPSLKNLFEEALQEGRPGPGKNGRPLLQKFADGIERFYRPEAVPIRNLEQRSQGVILILQDVTQLRQMDELKTDVIRTVSHQLKTPLTSIRMAIHLLLEEKVGPITEKQVELLLAAREDSDRLHEILTNLLDISRMKAGKARLDLDSHSPHALVLDAVEPYRRAAQDQGVNLFLDIRGNLPRVQVDRSRIGHVFGNLVTNALQHTAPGGRITVSLREEEEFIRFLISDSGAGIPEQYLAHVFDPFFRVPGETAPTGAGLGLAIVKEIVEAHGGRVGLESRAGQGSTFWFTLPRADRSEDADSARKEV